MHEPLEIACDESGAEGEKLIGGNTDTFAHASVLMDAETAAACVAELRVRAPTPATQYSAGHVLRDKHRAGLLWLLSPSGPVLGNVRVFLTDKTFYLVGKVAGLLQDDHAPRLGLDPAAAATAVTLYREGPRAFGAERWAAFLDSFNYLLRAKNGQGVVTSVEETFGLVDELRGAGGAAEAIMESLWRSRDRVEAFRERLLDDPYVFPALDPLIPAIVRAVTYWGADGRPVMVVHDQQTTLTDERVAQMREIAGGRMAGLHLVDSELDQRVQVADVMAGVVRKVATDELHGRGDPVLTELIRPYVDPESIWGAPGVAPDQVMSR
ncbi:hypothetical protein AB0M50_42585 [Nonomuraea fuscirosea]|uniref:DUF3800 domain-containing protein n=1 Tax=Nonomuraea fuscirosea TaxID=1291556 RepID=A0A2T0MRJ2_9ACTN|nr:hypothetical protein [Nonomuraea fuscirosea]PRX60864.1 hypothetical protein B0I32_116255 [Nonomuraea fuscirosea]WSA56369.1 hypothetical protein OIE67_17690 [Nonomuraea fuscirosea]